MPPHGIDLALYATLSADLAEGDRSIADVLASHDVTEAAWTEACVYWAAQMTTDAREAAAAGVSPRVALEFSEAFARAQDAKRPLPPFDARAWVLLGRDAGRHGLPRALATRGLSLADHGRLVRHWAARIATEPALRAEIATFEEADEGV